MRAALILVGLAALVVMELGTPPRKPKPVHEQLSQTTIGSSVSHDTLDPRDTAATTAQEPPKNIDQQMRSATVGKSAMLLPKLAPSREFPEQPSTPIAPGRPLRSSPAAQVPSIACSEH